MNNANRNKRHEIQNPQNIPKTSRAGAPGQVAGANGPAAGANLPILQTLSNIKNTRGAIPTYNLYEPLFVTVTNLNQSLHLGPPLKERNRKLKRSERHSLTEEYMNILANEDTTEDGLAVQLQNMSNDLQ